MPNRCMALLKLRTREEAQLFLETFNGKPFISMLDVRVHARRGFSMLIRRHH